MRGHQARDDGPGQYMVKGSTIRSKFEFVREHAGEQAERGFRREFESQSTILDSGWYPFQLYDDVNGKLVRQYLAGDQTRLEEVGRFSAARAFAGVYKSFLASRSFDRFLERIATLHRLMYSAGTIDVDADLDRRACRILQSGAPVYSERDLHVARGFYAEAAELFDLEGVRCRFSVTHDGAVFDLTWRAGGDPAS